MARLTWDAPDDRIYEIGIDRGVFYRPFEKGYARGVAWSGLIGVDDESSAGDAHPLYHGDVRVSAAYTYEECSGKIKCYTYPDEFEPYLGVTEINRGIFARNQPKKMFGFCYRSLVGNGTDGLNHGYKLHLLYNLHVSDFGRSYSSINNSVDLGDVVISFDSYAYEFSAFNLFYEPTSEIVIDSRLISADALQVVEEILYGENGEARLPSPDELSQFFKGSVVPPFPDDLYPYPHNSVFPKTDLYPYKREG